MGCGASTPGPDPGHDEDATERKYRKGREGDASVTPRERRRGSVARSDPGLESSRSQHREGSVTDDDVASLVGSDRGGAHDNPSASLTAKELASKNDPAIPSWLDNVLCASMALSILEEHLARKEAITGTPADPHSEFMVPDFSLDRPMDELNGSVTNPAHQSVANTMRPASAAPYCPNSSMSTATTSVTTAAHGSLTFMPSALSPYHRAASGHALRRSSSGSGSFSEPPRSALDQTMTVPSEGSAAGAMQLARSSSLPNTAPCTPNTGHLVTESAPPYHPHGNAPPVKQQGDNPNPSLMMESSGTTEVMMRGSSFRTPSERSVSGGSAMGSQRERDEDLFEGALATTPRSRSLSKGGIVTESMLMAIGICKAVMAAPAAARARFTTASTASVVGVDSDPVITFQAASASQQSGSNQSSPLQRKKEPSSYSLKSTSTAIVPMVDSSTEDIDEELLRSLAQTRPLPPCARAMLPAEILRRRAAMLAGPSVQYEPAVLSTNNLLRWEQEVDRSVILAVAQRRGVPAGLLSMTPLELAHAGVEDHEVFLALAEVHSGGCDGPAFMPPHPLWHRTGCGAWSSSLLRYIALETFNPFRLDAANKPELPRQGRWAHNVEAATLLRRFPTLQEAGSVARRIVTQGQSGPNGSTSVLQAKTSTTSTSSQRPVSASRTAAALINQRPLSPAVKRPTSAARMHQPHHDHPPPAPPAAAAQAPPVAESA